MCTTLTFACYRGSDYVFGFKILSFAIFWGVKVLSTIFHGYAIFHRYFLGVSFKMLIFMVYILYKV